MDRLDGSMFDIYLQKNSSLDVFFWSDVERYKVIPEEEERKRFLKEIWNNFFKGGSEPKISKETRQEVERAVLEGLCSVDILNKAGEEIFNGLWKESFLTFLKNCTLAAIYRKRSGSEGTLPDQVWDYLYTEMESIDWKKTSPVKNISRWMRNYKDFPVLGMRVSYSISAPPSFVADELFKSTGSKSQKLLEQIGPKTIIVHRRHKDPIPGIVKIDSVFLIARKDLDNDNIILLFRSVDHPNAPQTNGVKRLVVYAAASRIQSSSTIKGGTDIDRMSVIEVEGGGLSSNSDVLFYGFTKKEKSLRKSIEKHYQKQMKNTQL